MTKQEKQQELEKDLQKTEEQKLLENLNYYKKELKEYFNGVSDSYTRDLENTIEEIKKDLQERKK